MTGGDKTHEDIRAEVLDILKKLISKSIDELLSTGVLSQEDINTLNDFKKLIQSGSYIPLLIKNERRIKGEGRPDIEFLGGKILFEIKKKLSEFWGEEGGEGQLKRYMKHYPLMKYAVLTNNDTWVFYKRENGKLKRIYQTNDVNEAERKLKELLKDVLIQAKIKPSSDNIKALFEPLILERENLLNIFKDYEIENTAFYKAYETIINKLYSGLSDKEKKRLYITHTLLQMIVSATLTSSLGKTVSSYDACSGEALNIDISLPYLNWWKTIMNRMKRDDRKYIESLMDAIYSRAKLIDWNTVEKGDVFRDLYQMLVEDDTRRLIGEYYTPKHVVDFMIQRITDNKGGFKDKLILDPFCGSGSFLVQAFYKKIDEGEDPDKAFNEVIGLDINPLAVAIARAELALAYMNVKKLTIPTSTPLVFNTDSASVFLLGKPNKKLVWKPLSFIPQLQEIEKRIKYVSSTLYARDKGITTDFSEILRLEPILRNIFEETNQTKNYNELKKKLLQLKREKWTGNLFPHLIKELINEKTIDMIINLIKEYGDGIWAVSITSLFAPYLIRNMGVDIIISNPPWNLITNLKGDYGDMIREYAKLLLSKASITKSAGKIIISGDISSVLLGACKDVARETVSFVMPQDAVYKKGDYYGIRKILTYAAIKGWSGEIIQVNEDVFKHGVLPDIVTIYRENKDVKCYEMKQTLPKPLLEYIENYRNYIDRIKLYTEVNPIELAARLKIRKIVPMGYYIRGLFGGALKDKNKYAGLVFKVISYDKNKGEYYIQLHNTNSIVKIPEYFLIKYWKKLLYVGSIYSFYIEKLYDVLLHEEGAEVVKEFLEKHIKTQVSKEDKPLIEKLIEELKQSKNIVGLNTKLFYVIYRKDGAFVSSVIVPSYLRGIPKIPIIASDCGFLETDNDEIVYYYSAILNYLVWKTKQMKRRFARHQYSKPLLAILDAGLEWKQEIWQHDVAEISKKIHNLLANNKQLFTKYYSKDSTKFLLNLYCNPQIGTLLKNMFDIIDKHIDPTKLDKALDWVSEVKTINK